MANAIKKGKFMKKQLILILSIILVMFIGCNQTQKDKNGDELMSVNFKSGIYHDKNWDEKIGTYQRDVIPNEKAALKLAVQIFESMQKSIEVQNYIPQSVFFDEEDEIWIISFGEQSDKVIVGGDCSIAMQKKDGKVMRIWFGE